MQQLFPRPLVVCIREAKPPRVDEVAELGARIWSEGLAFCGVGRAVAERMAMVALSGGGALAENGASAAPLEEKSRPRHRLPSRRILTAWTGGENAPATRLPGIMPAAEQTFREEARINERAA